MLEIIGMILLTAAGAAVGDEAARSLARFEKELKDLLSLLDEVGILLSSCSLSTEEIFIRIGESEYVYSHSFHCEGDDITDKVSACLRTSGLAMCGELAGYISRFGETDLEGQLARNGLLRHEVSLAYDAAAEKRKKFSNIYRVGGFSAGLVAALLLI